MTQPRPARPTSGDMTLVSVALRRIRRFGRGEAYPEAVSNAGDVTRHCFPDEKEVVFRRVETKDASGKSNYLR